MARRRIGGAEGVLFPWEDRGGLRRFLALGRIGPIVTLSLVLGFVSWVLARERDMAGERRTLVALHRLEARVERFLLENDGKCPRSLDELGTEDGQPMPLDGWGRPFRLLCPVEERSRGFVLMSDGPDGLPGGTDRIEY